MDEKEIRADAEKQVKELQDLAKARGESFKDDLAKWVRANCGERWIVTCDTFGETAAMSLPEYPTPVFLIERADEKTDIKITFNLRMVANKDAMLAKKTANFLNEHSDKLNWLLEKGYVSEHLWRDAIRVSNEMVNYQPKKAKILFK